MYIYNEIMKPHSTCLYVFYGDIDTIVFLFHLANTLPSLVFSSR